MSTAKEIFAINIRRYRNKLGITQEELAERSGLHRTYIGSVERAERNISINNIERIAHGLNVSINILLDNSEYNGR